MLRLPPILAGVLVAACSAPGTAKHGSAAPDSLVVFVAASLVQPVHSAIGGYSARTRAVVQEERGGSVELARRITELHRVPDLIVLADADVFAQQLVPRATSWFLAFGRDRMVIAYTSRSRMASAMSPDSWRRVLTQPGVRIGRADPGSAPVGYRTLAMLALAERHYRDAGLAARVLTNARPEYMRADAAQLATLLEEGEVDYIIDYESVARARHLEVVHLPAEIDLGDLERAEQYGAVRVRFKRGRDSVEVKGAPIALALSVPKGAAHGASGVRLAHFLLADDGWIQLRGAGVDMLERPRLTGDSVPALLRPLVLRRARHD